MAHALIDLLRETHPDAIASAHSQGGDEVAVVRREKLGEVCRFLKDDPRTARIPIVALTSLAMKGDREWFLAFGFDGYLEKPISVRELPGQVRSFCVSSRREDDGR